MTTNNLISSLEMRPEADLTMDFVKERLVEEYKIKSGFEKKKWFCVQSSKEKKISTQMVLLWKTGISKKACRNREKNNNRVNNILA